MSQGLAASNESKAAPAISKVAPSLGPIGQQRPAISRVSSCLHHAVLRRSAIWRMPVPSALTHIWVLASPRCPSGPKNPWKKTHFDTLQCFPLSPIFCRNGAPANHWWLRLGSFLACQSYKASSQTFIFPFGFLGPLRLETWNFHNGKNKLRSTK